MKLLRPRTFLNFVLLGFVVVSLPLGVGLWTTLNHIERVTGEGLVVVEHAVKGTKDSEFLSEYLRSEERTMRLFSIIGDKEYLKQAEKYHGQIDTLLFELLGLPLDPSVLSVIEEMRQSRNKQRVILISVRDGTIKTEPQIEIKKAIESFTDQQKQTETIRTGIQTLMENDITGLKRTTNEAQQTLVSQTFVFILATIIMIAVMTFLLSWPIRQLNKSVERMGKGDFKTPVIVSGPLDVEAVGEKLDWLRKRLDLLEQEKTKFLAHISHELKTPLASIMEGAALLNEGLVGELNEKQQNVSTILLNNGFVLQRLIENIIGFNMAQAGRNYREKSLVDLRLLLEEVSQTMATPLMGRNISLDIKLKPAAVYGDRKELETIFENLFSNAVKFCPRGGIVGCRLSTDTKNAACIIYDNGPGVPVEEREKIFQPFYQVETEAHSVVKGSGLGLAIVHEYVKHHGGSVRLLNPGEPGARFGVTLPFDGDNDTTPA